MVTGRRRESRRRVLELCYWLAPDEDAAADAADYIDRGAMPNAVKDVTDAEAQELLAKVAAFRERCLQK